MRSIVLQYPIWQEPYRAAVIETNPKLLKQKIASAHQAVILRLDSAVTPDGSFHAHINLEQPLGRHSKAVSENAVEKIRMSDHKVGDDITVKQWGGRLVTAVIKANVVLSDFL